MGLIKKSVLDIERKAKYARYVMRVLKECNLVKEFIDYIDTKAYLNFAERYASKNSTCTLLWYDKEYCANILGCCNFERYLECKYDAKKAKRCNSYHLLLCYLAIFDKDEYDRYARRDSTYNSTYISSDEYIKNALHNNNYEQGCEDIEIINKWLKFKEIML